MRLSPSRLDHRARLGKSLAVSSDSPTIYRCSNCGSLVHPPEETSTVAWCPRCRRYNEVRLDGGDG
jgi:uncharacterized paraquat-inducible protein A